MRSDCLGIYYYLSIDVVNKGSYPNVIERRRGCCRIYPGSLVYYLSAAKRCNSYAPSGQSSDQPIEICCTICFITLYTCKEDMHKTTDLCNYLLWNEDVHLSNYALQENR